VVAYVNTTAEVKAETDICCTSANAVQVVEWAARTYGSDRVILLPDEFLARNVARQTSVKIIAWAGRCEVHERFSAEDVRAMREAYPGAEILAHPECPPDVLAAADFAGSTGAMSDYVARRRPARVVLITECSMADNIACETPETEFVRPCNLCPHMKRITLEGIWRALKEGRHVVEVDPSTAERARASVERMIALPPPAAPARYDLVRAARHVPVELV
jgi:quinolinate synthase